MKEMIYGANPKQLKILANGDYKGLQYIIINRGGDYPCAYVENTWEYDENDPYFENMPCHCGITFHSSLVHLKKDNPNAKGLEKNYIGWDYGHLWDYKYCLPDEDDEKWTTEKVFKDVKKVINYILKENEKAMLKENNKQMLNDIQQRFLDLISIKLNQPFRFKNGMTTFMFKSVNNSLKLFIFDPSKGYFGQTIMNQYVFSKLLEGKAITVDKNNEYCPECGQKL